MSTKRAIRKLLTKDYEIIAAKVKISQQDDGSYIVVSSINLSGSEEEPSQQGQAQTQQTEVFFSRRKAINRFMARHRELAAPEEQRRQEDESRVAAKQSVRKEKKRSGKKNK